MNAAALASALGGRQVGGGWMASCPTHEDREPSLSISERGSLVLIHCHAGCTQVEVIAELRAKGLWAACTPEDPAGRRAASKSSPADDDRENDDRRERALNLWAAAGPAAGTLVETYLRSRGIHLPPPESLRFHQALRHPSGGAFPAMVALVTRATDDHPLGVHRTFLASNGCGKALVTPQKMMLGPCRGGVVRLGRADTALMIGEGIETCLSAIQATGKVAWAALSTSGLRALDPPVAINDIIVLADGDRPGEAAAESAAHRWRDQGRIVRIARAPAGMDFNDLLRVDAVARPGRTS